jgi:bacterioferritin
MAEQSFISDIQQIRERARHHIERGAVTDTYRASTETVMKLLNEALATELVCVLRYKRHYWAVEGLRGESVKGELWEHAVEEQVHADKIAERITQLGGLPNLSPEGLISRSHTEYVEGASLLDMLKEDLVAERIAIDSYTEIIRFIGDADPTTRRLMEEILAQEEEHATDMSTLIRGLNHG